MIRTKLDNLELDSIQSISDVAALGRTNYAGSLRIAKLYALLAVAMQIQLELSTEPDSRQKKLADNICEMHISGIKKRIAQVEAVNDRKASKARSTRTMAEMAEIITSAHSLSRIRKINPSGGLPVIAPETRAKIAAPIIADMNAPTTDEAYADIIARANKLDEERAAQKAIEESTIEVRELGDSGLKTLDDGKDKIGSVEDWMKNL